MEPVLTGLFLVALYKATEKFWEKGFDAAWEPLGGALKERVTRWAGRDKASLRRVAFAEAVNVARANTLRYAADPQHAAKVLKELDESLDRSAATAFAEEAAKLMLFSATPDVPRLTELCHRTLRYEAAFAEETPPPPEAVAVVLSDFLTNLREALLDQEPYHDLIQRETLRALRQVVAELRPVDYDTEATYRTQLAAMYRELEFVGIPELKERRPITVEDIFVRLRAEREAEVPDIPGEVLAERMGMAVEPAELMELRGLRPRVVKEQVAVDEALRENRRLGMADDPDGARDEARAFVRLARGRTGLLVERGEGVFGFPHLTFQEYLAARDVENRCIHRGVDAIWEEIEPRLHDPHWREVILLLLGSLNEYDEPPTLLVERILAAGEGDEFEPVLHRHLYLAARALADRVDVADDLHRQVVAATLDIARTAPWGEREDAFTALSWLEGDSYAAEGLLGLARDAAVDAGVRYNAASALGQLGWTEEAAEILLELARDEGVSDHVRSAAYRSLKQLVGGAAAD